VIALLNTTFASSSAFGGNLSNFVDASLAPELEKRREFLDENSLKHC